MRVGELLSPVIGAMWRELRVASYTRSIVEDTQEGMWITSR